VTDDLGPTTNFHRVLTSADLLFIRKTLVLLFPPPRK
jgi:hypothetical protein